MFVFMDPIDKKSALAQVMPMIWLHETYVKSKKQIWIMAWSLLHELWMNGISLTRAQVK